MFSVTTGYISWKKRIGRFLHFEKQQVRLNCRGVIRCQTIETFSRKGNYEST